MATRTTRRELLQWMAASVPALAMNRSMLAAAAPQPLGVQLYTVRNLVGNDLPGVLAQIRKIGYREVETYWNVYTHPAPQLRQMIQDAGLSVPSGHFDYDGFDEKFEYARQLGVQYMICPMLPVKMWNSADGFKRAAEQFNRWGQKTQSLGMRFAFHNHDYEFQSFGKTTGFEILMAHTDPSLVGWEMDCYWVTQAGMDPVTMLRQYKNRVHLLHLKDRKPGYPPSHELNAAAEHFTEVGTGSIDWKQVLRVARQQGIRYYFVEQDQTTLPPLESLQVSYNNLRKIMA